ncbi:MULTISPECIES: twin-arginine translocase subunit TatC [Haloarcula]|uniref:twin-arginine translocase subunit TatC n=1 Tax=Haloarcula TaxID=2237 RepID=UPI0023EDD601|nr:twin-arginine translocase subunit TatC [Halomicroarcula sp. XH51]
MPDGNADDDASPPREDHGGDGSTPPSDGGAEEPSPQPAEGGDDQSSERSGDYDEDYGLSEPVRRPEEHGPRDPVLSDEDVADADESDTDGDGGAESGAAAADADADDGADTDADGTDVTEYRTVSDPHGLLVKQQPPLFERDPSKITAAIPADIPTDWGIPQPTGVGDAGGAPSPPEHDYDVDEMVDQGAPDDEEMPLADHVEEMALRLFAVVGVMAAVTIIALPASDELIQFLWFSFLDGPAEACGSFAVGGTDTVSAAGPDCPHVYSPLALILARLKVASLVGLIAALPVFVYQTYLFMRPGLYPRERRYYLAAVPTSLVLAAIGVGFAYFAVLRAMFDYFITYSDRAADLAFGLGDTFNLIILMLGFFALIFQIPLFVMLAIMMGVTTRQWLQDRRLYFWGAFAAIAFVFSPDPTGMAPLMVAVTMITLFEGTLLLLRWTGDASPVPTPEEAAARRPFVWLAALLAGYVLSPAPVPTGYYTRLPPVVTESLASIGLGNATPMLLGGSIIVAFELLAYLNKNYYGSVRAWRAFRRARLPVWAVGIVAGYLASPDPTLFRLVNQVSLEPTAATALAAALIALFEVSLFVAHRRARSASES